MNELIRFFESNGIKISRVLPFTSEDKNSKVNYLNFSSKEKQAAFILYLTELIKIKFKGLEKNQMMPEEGNVSEVLKKAHQSRKLQTNL